MITTKTSDAEQIRLTRATSGAAYQHVTLTTGEHGISLHVRTRLDARHGDGWAEASLDSNDLIALRDWIDAHLARGASA